MRCTCFIVFFLSVSDRILFLVICILYSVIMTGWQNRFLVQILSLILLFIYSFVKLIFIYVLTSVGNLNIVFFKSQTSGDLPEGIHIPTVDNEYGCGE